MLPLHVAAVPWRNTRCAQVLLLALHTGSASAPASLHLLACDECCTEKSWECAVGNHGVEGIQLGYLLWATFAAHQGVFANHLHAVSCLSPRVLSAWGSTTLSVARTLPCTHSLIPQFTLLCAAGCLLGLLTALYRHMPHTRLHHILVVLLPVQLQLCSILALRS